MTDVDPALAATIAARSRGRIDLVAWALSPETNRAVVLLGVQDSGYWLESLYERREGGWSEVMTSNGTRSYGAGVYRLYGDAPEDAHLALVSWRDATYEVPIQNGHFAFAAWNVTDAEFEMFDPELMGFIDARGNRLVEHS